MNDCEQIKKKKKNERIELIVIQIIIVIVLLLLWEFLARWKIIDEFLISKPSSIYLLLKRFLISGELFKHIYISLLETILGIIIGSSLGIFIAIILWYFPKVTQVINPFLVVLNALPKTALAPIMIIWAGTGITGIVVVAISILIIVTILSTYNYFMGVDEEKIKMLRSFKASKLQIFTKLIFPSNIVNVISVVRINIGLAWVGVIVGEFLVSRAGIGYEIMYGGQVFDLGLVMMWVIVLSLLALGMNLIVSYFEKKILKKRGKQ